MKDIKRKITDYILSNKKWIIDNFSKLISQDTTNNPPGGNENNGQEILEGIFLDLGMEIDRFPPSALERLTNSSIYNKGRDYTNRDNLVGSIGQGKGYSLIFNGHMDTVPSDVFEWKETEPFIPKVKNNKIYGLGASDMKGGIITSVMALKAIIDLKIPIKGKVVIESVVDEEFGGGNGSLACIERGYKGDFAIITEPTSMEICISNVSSVALDIKIKGISGLEYLGNKKETPNAILVTAKLIKILKEYEKHLNHLKTNYPVFKKIEKPINFLFSEIKTVGGNNKGIFTSPQCCVLRVYMQNYPDKDREGFFKQMFSYLREYSDIFELIEDKTIVFSNSTVNCGQHRYIEGGELDSSNQKNKEFLYSIMNNAKEFLNKKLKTSAFLGGSDFFCFSNYGKMPVVLLGPRGNNHHSGDEHVFLDDIYDLSIIFSNIIYDFCC